MCKKTLYPKPVFSTMSLSERQFCSYIYISEGQNSEPWEDRKCSSGPGRNGLGDSQKAENKRKKQEKHVPTRGKTSPGKETSRRKLPRPKAEAVLIKPSGENKMSYANMLKELKTKLSTDEVGSMVDKIRKTMNQNLLIELRKDSKLEELIGSIPRSSGRQIARKTAGSNGQHCAKRPEGNDHRRRDKRSVYRCPGRGDPGSSRIEGSPCGIERDQNATRSDMESHSDCKGAKARQS